ncbi:MAG: glycosyltransferase, partial [Solirubrobacterales bacterium]|nr:glycosyltransferase [Solirubrobacterales bacterium]
VPSVARAVQLTQKAPVPAGAPYVLHLSRWDRLKDPVGVMEAFARHVVPRVPAHLVLAGPSPSVVDDDPEGAQVLEEVLAAWADLPGDRRAAVHVAVLPLEAAANDLVVNALQRGAAVVVKKSIGEGFGLGLTEALWKARPVVASAVGGVREQVVDEVTGLLVDDPGDLRAAGAAIVRLVEHPGVAAALGRAGHRHVRRRFLEPRHLVRWTGLLQEVVSPRAGP